QATGFSRSKHAGDADLLARDLDWVILRPSVVVGPPAYGGSALLRGLAALPVWPVMPGTGPLQLVHLDDVLALIENLLKPHAPARHVLEVVGPRSFTFAEAVGMFRNWLRFAPARSIRLPPWLARAAFRVGDLVSLLGWRPPLRSTAGVEIAFGATGDREALRRLTGFETRDVEQMLAREPASVQERWFARLYFLKPLMFAVFGAFWIAT